MFLNNLDKAFLELTGQKDMPIVVDVHTEPNSGQVLEEAIGYPKSIYYGLKKSNVVILDPGANDYGLESNAVARGALFTHYEFKHPMSDRLTDAAWQAMLKERQAQ